MIAPTPAPMRVYDGLIPLGEIEDHGRDCVLAYGLTASGRVLIGRFPDRRSAIRAVRGPKAA